MTAYQYSPLSPGRNTGRGREGGREGERREGEREGGMKGGIVQYRVEFPLPSYTKHIHLHLTAMAKWSEGMEENASISAYFHCKGMNSNSAEPNMVSTVSAVLAMKCMPGQLQSGHTLHACVRQL